jgi:ferric-dicitrate binding protein FerR (iron transport regulator)
MIQYLDQPQGYRPGACNIGPAEIRRRQVAGVLGIVAALGLGVLLLVLGAPPVARLLVALPLAAGFSGFLQARLHFCANYGWRGIRNLGAIGDVERVEDAEARRADRRKALAIFGTAAAGGLAVALLFALLPI